MAAAGDLRFLDVAAGPADSIDGEHTLWCRGPVEAHTSAVLFIHDRAANARSWDLVMRRLPAGIALIAVDLRGRGSAWRRSPSLGIESHLRDLADLLDRLDIDDVVAVGHGFGAVVASELARTAPDRVPLTVGVIAEPGNDPFDPLLGHGFLDRDEHLRFWSGHPRFVEADAAALDGFVSHGTAGTLDHHRWRADLRSIVADDRSRLEVPSLRLTRSISVGRLMAPQAVSIASGEAAIGTITHLPDLDPATLLLTRAGADAIAAQIRPLLG